MTTAPAEVIDLADRVRAIAEQDPDRVALVRARRLTLGRGRYSRHTYRELSDRADRLAAGLHRVGVTKGTRCSFMVPPGIDAMVLGIALWQVGAVVVGIEPHSHGLRAVARSLAKVEPEVFFGTPEAIAGRVAFGWGRGSVRTNVVVGGIDMPGLPSMRSLERGPGRPVENRPAPEDVAVIAFTTGSTGAPKPTVLRQRNLAAMMSTVLGHWAMDGADVVDMLTFPMFWIIGLAAGGTVVVPPIDFALKGPGDADAAVLVRTIQECGVRSMFASPAVLTNLVAHARTHDIGPLGLRRITAGGAEVPGPLFAEVRKLLDDGGEMYSDYGATEALPVAEIAGREVVEETWPLSEQGAGVCVGRALPGVELRIVEISDAAIPTWADATELAPGEVGEVVARSPHISEEYWRQPDTTAQNKIADDAGAWHRIGDTGYLDDRGRLWVCGRVSHRVVTPRGVLYPLRCEPVVNAHDAVRRSALVGVPDADGVTRAVLCIEPNDPPADPGRLLAELRELLDAHPSTRPVDRLEIVERLPVDRRHNAKIDRPAVAARLAAGTTEPALRS